MQKRILFRKEAREKLLKGVNVIADAVSVTLGPSGKNVLIGGSEVVNYNTYHLPTRVTKDGVSVAKEIYLEDPTENRGALLLREASEKTMSQVGDGTTTTIVLARAIVNEGMKLIDAGENSVELKRGIDKAVEYVVCELQKMAIPIGNDVEKIRHIATIAGNNDNLIGDLIAEAFSKIGSDGVIDIEESMSDKTEVKITDGVKIDRGWLIPNFNTNRSKNECELNDVMILLYDKTISKISQIQKYVEHCNKNNKSLFVCCNDMDSEALAFLVINAQKQAIKCCVVRNPGFGEARINEMEDLAISTGATFVSDLKGIAIDRASLSVLGSAKKIVVSKDQTVIVEGGKKQNDFTDYMNNLQMNRVVAEGEEKSKIEKRIARLNGGIAVIAVGGATEVEMKERKDRVDDAIRATKSAIADGYCIGGGTIFLKISSTGSPIMDKALRTPIKQICMNAGIEIYEKKWWQFWKRESVIDKVRSSGDNVGYNAKTNSIENMIDAGVIDSIKVLKSCIINSASVATMILTSESTIVDIY